jgi:hypothetical protein
MTRFVVATDDLTADQEREFIAFLREHRASWWHRLQNFWLIDDPGRLSPISIRDKIADEIAPGTDCLVFSIKGDTHWAGFGPTAEKKSMFAWLNKNWQSETEN